MNRIALLFLFVSLSIVGSAQEPVVVDRTITSIAALELPYTPLDAGEDADKEARRVALRKYLEESGAFNRMLELASREPIPDGPRYLLALGFTCVTDNWSRMEQYEEFADIPLRDIPGPDCNGAKTWLLKWKKQ